MSHSTNNYSAKHYQTFANKMLSSVDLYLGSFLIVAGFALSLLNLRRLIKGGTSLPAVLISENVLLMCIGIAFMSRSIYKMNTFSTDMDEIEERINNMEVSEQMDCNFVSILKTYGPLVVSLVNSFLSLIIDNYMHYRMLSGIKKDDDDNTIQDLRSYSSDSMKVSNIFLFFKKYFSYIAVAMQWVVPVLIALAMYPMEVKEKRLLDEDFRRSSDSCMAMVDVTNKTCSYGNYSLELRQLAPSYLETNENNSYDANILPKIDFVVNNVQKVISNWKNDSLTNFNVFSGPLWRRPKIENGCMRVCYVDNKSLLLYMFVISIVSYFIPITISTIILTKVHMMDVKRSGMKAYVSRELLYNILFWTPVMFDTFLSLILCSYSMNGMRTSIFNVVANVYQAVKNFMNTKYFHENSVEPITA